MLILPVTPEVIHSFVAQAEAAPEELSTIANVMAAPPMPFLPAEVHGRLIIMAMLVYAGEEVDEGERAIAPFRTLAIPIVDMVKPWSSRCATRRSTRPRRTTTTWSLRGARCS